eukprot:TRINITY_DN10596_c0_g3_i1.p2 TRINITY_DN10596_c0_g3~~TRINITY_DN10596_c0_g3_i1.p2  ORF type:complete len:224 (+),score=79.96 TRINITY_DN10596_c0_g3_i1:80-751(+)
MAVTKAARDRRLVSVLLATSLFLPMAFNFALVGSAQGRIGRDAARVRAHATSFMRMPLPEMNPLPWAEDLQGAKALQHDKCMKAVDKCVQLMAKFDKGLADGLTFEQMQEYDRVLAAGVLELENEIVQTQSDLLRDSMEVKSDAQLVWLEFMLQNIGDLRRQLKRLRSAEGKLKKRMAMEERGFLQKLIQAAAVAFSGHRGVLHSDYPATGVASYTGEPNVQW